MKRKGSAKNKAKLARDHGGDRALQLGRAASAVLGLGSGGGDNLGIKVAEIVDGRRERVRCGGGFRIMRK